MTPARYIFTLLIATMIFVVITAGCGGGSGDAFFLEANSTYRVSVTNITHNQPFSPMALVVHIPGYRAWNVGQAVTEGLERLAEEGDPSAFLYEAGRNIAVWQTNATQSGIGPGESASIEFCLTSPPDLRITAATMLTNTNDAFTGIVNQYIGDLEVDESIIFFTEVYDAGTEANSETEFTIPGPAGNGEGYNPVRDDTNQVTVHSGVITRDDGLIDSALDLSHRFENPVAVFQVTRIQ